MGWKMGKDSEDIDRLDSILGRFVDSNGNVDYDSLKEEIDIVEKYVEWIKSFNPESLKTLNEKIAFWINTYNMLTIYGIIIEIKNNPSFMKKGNKSKLQRLKFFWLKKYKVGGKNHSLYQIENDILRNFFSEPRIHFALNCGSQSCPLLKDGLYSSKNLEKELNVAATLFIQSSRGSMLDKEEKILYLSKIFEWYSEDFKKSGTIIDFVKKYMKEEDQRFIEDHEGKIKIKYLDYNWGLNLKN
jgi:hypothetical protein